MTSKLRRFAALMTDLYSGVVMLKSEFSVYELDPSYPDFADFSTAFSNGSISDTPLNFTTAFSNGSISDTSLNFTTAFSNGSISDTPENFTTAFSNGSISDTPLNFDPIYDDTLFPFLRDKMFTVSHVVDADFFRWHEDFWLFDNFSPPDSIKDIIFPEDVLVG